jgi:hypothetical protein
MHPAPFSTHPPACIRGHFYVMASPEKKKPRLDRGFRLDGGKTAGIVKTLQIPTMCSYGIMQPFARMHCV